MVNAAALEQQFSYAKSYESQMTMRFERRKSDGKFLEGYFSNLM